MRPFFLGLIAALGGWAPASAQTPDSSTVATNRMTLRDCTRVALARSRRLNAAVQDEVASREAADEARGSYYPTLGVRGAVSRWQNRAFLPGGLDAPNRSPVVGPTDDWSAGGFARYLLYDSGVRRANLDAASATHSGAGQNSEATRQAVVFEVHEEFCRLAVALELRTVAGAGLASAEAHLGVAKSRRAAGDAAEADVSRAQVEVDGARAELIRTESQVRIARGDLNAVMGLPAEAPLDVDAGSIAGPSDEPLDVGALIEQAVRVRPEIKAAQSAITAARQHVEAAKGAYGPRVYADGSWGWRADSASLDDEAWFAGVTVELTVFEGFSRRHALKMSEAVAARAEAILDQVRLAVRREVWTACARIQETRELVRATVTQVRDAEESVRLMAARYRAGAVTVTGLLDAQTALTAAQARHVQARWGYRAAQAALRRATGAAAWDNSSGN